MKMRHTLAALLLLCLALVAPVGAQERQTSVKVHTVLGVASKAPASPEVGDRWLVGPGPASEWAGQSGKIATWTGSNWSTKVVNAPDQIYDAGAGRIYAKTDSSSYVNLWAGSYYVELSPAFPKFRPTIPFTGDLTVGTSLIGSWLVASPDTPSTLTLTSPTSVPAMASAQIMLEKSNSVESLTILVSGSGSICDQNLKALTPFVLGPKDRKLLHLLAGNAASVCSWYVIG